MWRWPVGLYGWTPPSISLHVRELGRLAPGARDARLAVDRRRGVEQAGLGERRERERRGRRVAAGIRDLPRVEHVLRGTAPSGRRPNRDRAGSPSRGRRRPCRRSRSPHRTGDSHRAAGRGRRRRSARARPARARRSPRSAPGPSAATAAGARRAAARARGPRSPRRPRCPRSASAASVSGLDG